MRMIDAHQHFWDLERNRHPWLQEAPVDFRYGDYEALKTSYRPDDYRRDAAAFAVVGTVYVEAEWAANDPLGETAYVSEIAAFDGLPSVIVGQAWLDRDDVEQVLDAHAAHPMVRGVRHKPAAAASREAIEPGAPGSMSDMAWRRGFGLLAARGLSFDLQVPWWHLDEALDLAAAHPETTIVLNHAGLPSDRSEGGLAGWRATMRRLADAPNVFVKISGLGQKGRRWSVEANKPIVMDVLEIFGVSRCMFASNFPVDSLVGSFETIYGGYLDMTEDLDPRDRAALFFDNAQRVYRIDARALGPEPSRERPS